MIALTPNLYDYIYSQREQEMWVSVEKVFVCRFDLWREWAAQSLSTALWGLGKICKEMDEVTKQILVKGVRGCYHWMTRD